MEKDKGAGEVGRGGEEGDEGVGEGHGGEGGEGGGGGGKSVPIGGWGGGQGRTSLVERLDQGTSFDKREVAITAVILASTKVKSCHE